MKPKHSKQKTRRLRQRRERIRMRMVFAHLENALLEFDFKKWFETTYPSSRA